MPSDQGAGPATKSVLEVRTLDSSLRSAAFGMTVAGVLQGSPYAGMAMCRLTARVCGVIRDISGGKLWHSTP